MGGFLLTYTHLRVFSEALEQLYSPVTLEEFPRVLMKSLASVIDCTSVSFNETNLAAREFRTEYLGEVSDEVMARWLHFAHEHPGVNYVAAGGPMRVFAITDFVTQRQFRDTGIYKNIFEPLGVETQLAAVLPVSGAPIGVALNRETEFSDRDKMLLELFRAHMMRAYFNAEVLTSLRRPKSEAPDFLPWRRAGLTRRECETLHWVTEGKRDGEIAVVLKVSCRTVNHHVGSILRKLGVETRTTAAARALEMLKDREPVVALSRRGSSVRRVRS